MIDNSKILNGLQIFVGLLLFITIILDVIILVSIAHEDGLNFLVGVSKYNISWAWLAVTLLMAIALLKRVRWITTIVILNNIYTSVFDMDSIYLPSTRLDKITSILDLVILVLIIFANLLWFLELWKRKGKKEYDPKNKYAMYRIKLTPFLFVAAWLVLLLGLLCSFWATPYFYYYSNQANEYLVLLSAVAAYFIILFVVNWGIIYRQNGMVLFLLLATTFLMYPATLNLHIVAWFHFAWWEILLLLAFSLAVFILELVCFCFEWLWVMERRTARNIKKQKQSPAWAKIFVAALLVFALIRIMVFAYTEYFAMASMRQTVVYYLNPKFS